MLLPIDLAQTSYFLGREKLIASATSGIGRARELLLAFLSHNAHSATAYFQIPPNQLVELVGRVEL